MDNEKRFEIENELRTEHYKIEMNGKEENMIWVIAFYDGERDMVEKHFWREELIDENGEFVECGDVKTFKTEQETEDFIKRYLDMRAFDFFSFEITEEELNKYREEMD